jgi:uncharacterized protein (DUF58 family)
MSADEAIYLDYRVRWRAGAARPGKHASSHAGSGGDIRAVRPFWQAPDAQRIDIRRSIMDPAGGIMVRQTDHRSSLTLMLAVDVSRSMMPARIAPLAAAAARSAGRAGDAFGLICFDGAVRGDIGVRSTRWRGAGAAGAAALAAFDMTGRSAEGLRDVASHLPARRCLVLLVSDFLLPLATVDAALGLLGRHAVTPVVLDNVPADVPRFGLCRLRDAETGQARLLLMRPAVRQRWRDAGVARRAALAQLFARHGLNAFHAGGDVDIAALSRHLAGA